MQTYLHHFWDMVANKSATVVGLPVDVEVLQHFFQLFCTRPTKFFFNLFIMALRSLAASFVVEILWKEKEQDENRDKKNKDLKGLCHKRPGWRYIGT